MPKLLLLAAPRSLRCSANLPQPADPADRAVPARRQRGHHGAPHRRAAGGAVGGKIVIDNRSGASGNIGMEAAARAKPDGHSLVLNTIPLATNQALFDKLAWDPIKDFAPIGMVATRRARRAAEVKARSVDELVRLAREPRQAPTPRRASAPRSTCAARCSRTRPRPSSCTCPTAAAGRRSPTRSAARST